MRNILSIPSRQQAENFIREAELLNPGGWIAHSVLVGQAAEIIASHLPDLDPQAAAILGLLHDIGRRAGVTDIRHCIDGYKYLHELGFEDAARICITHIFTIQDIRAANGVWDCSEIEIQFIQQYLMSLQYDDYDRLIQLCDALALSTGFCLLEKGWWTWLSGEGLPLRQSISGRLPSRSKLISKLASENQSTHCCPV